MSNLADGRGRCNCTLAEAWAWVEEVAGLALGGKIRPQVLAEAVQHALTISAVLAGEGN
ncbi:MAG TPA: hypothetical protein VNL15_03895 [Dehalococcoidia bacterium]|nr:hypothetical protein [Dehalococcoidia bacterium]